MDVMVLNAGQREQEVRDVKREIADMLRHIQRLNGDLEVLLRKVRTKQTPTLPSVCPPPYCSLLDVFFCQYPDHLSKRACRRRSRR